MKEHRGGVGGAAAASPLLCSSAGSAAGQTVNSVAGNTAAAERCVSFMEAGEGDETGEWEGIEDALASALTEMEARFETVSVAILNRLDDMTNKVDELEQQLQSLVCAARRQQQVTEDVHQQSTRELQEVQETVDTSIATTTRTAAATSAEELCNTNKPQY